MTLILSNDDVEQLLTMPDCIAALEDAYVELAEGRGINSPVTAVEPPRYGWMDCPVLESVACTPLCTPAPATLGMMKSSFERRSAVLP